MSGVSGVGGNSFVPPNNDEEDDKSVYSQESASAYSQESAVENRTGPQLDLDPSSLGDSSAPAPRRPLAQNTMTGQSADSAQQPIAQKRQLGQFIEGNSGNSGAPAQISPLRRGIGGTMSGQPQSTEAIRKRAPEEKFVDDSAPGASTAYPTFRLMGVGGRAPQKREVDISTISGPSNFTRVGPSGSQTAPPNSAPQQEQQEVPLGRQKPMTEEEMAVSPRTPPQPKEKTAEVSGDTEIRLGRGQVREREGDPKTFAEMGVTTAPAEKPPTSISKRIGRLLKPSSGAGS
jgi:hypothetical protein